MWWLTLRWDENVRKEFRERNVDRDREREKERRQREKERIRRQDEDRRRRREQQDGENTFRKQEEIKKERALEKKRSENLSTSHSEKAAKKDESGKRERLRNKVCAPGYQTFEVFLERVIKWIVCFDQDRPAIQLYQPGARSRNRATAEGGEANSADRKPDTENKKVSEKGEDWADFYSWYLKFDGLMGRPCTADETGLRPALPVSEVKLTLVPECDPLKMMF